MHGPGDAYYERIARWSATDKYRGELAYLWRLMGLDPGARVLDLGCGAGATLRALAAAGAHPFGVERGSGFERHVAGQAVARGDALALPFDSDTFDGVVLMHVFAHLVVPAAALAEVRRVLRAGGALGIVTPNAVHMTAVRLGPGRDRTYVPDLTVERHWRLGAIRRAIARAGLKVRVVERFGPTAPGFPLACTRERLVVIAERLPGLPRQGRSVPRRGQKLSGRSWDCGLDLSSNT